MAIIIIIISDATAQEIVNSLVMVVTTPTGQHRPRTVTTRTLGPETPTTTPELTDTDISTDSESDTISENEDRD